MIHASTGHSVAGGMKPVGCYPEHMGIFFPTAASAPTLAGLQENRDQVRVPGHALAWRGSGRTRANDRKSPGRSTIHPVEQSRRGSNWGARLASHRSGKHGKGPRERGNSAGESSSRRPIAAASSGRFRPGSAHVRTVWARAARPRPAASSSVMKPVVGLRDFRDHLPFSIWERFFTETSAQACPES